MKQIRLVKQTTLLLSIFLTLNIYSMEEASKVKKTSAHENIDSIDEDVRAMKRLAKSHCSFFARLLRVDCDSKRECKFGVYNKYGTKRDLHIREECMTLCSSMQFNKKWAYDKVENLTLDDWWSLQRKTNSEDSAIRECTDECFTSYWNMYTAARNAREKLAEDQGKFWFNDDEHGLH